jgi:hypothetical protein
MRANPEILPRRAGTTARTALLALAALLGPLAGPPRATADSVALSWTAPGDDGNVGTASSYDMRYSQTPVAADTAGWWASATSVGTMPPPLRAGSRESFIVAGLAPGATYYFAIRSSDEVPNVSGFSNIAVKQTTSGGVTLATPGNFSAGATPGAVLLTWTAVPSGGPELGYHLYRKATAEPVPSLLKTLPLTAASWNDSTAAAGLTYAFSLAAYDDSIEGTPATLTVTMPGGGAVTAAATTDVVHGYPNPARDQVTFRLQIDAASSDQRTRVTVFDLTGHRICVLADAVLPAGEHTIPWACRSDQGYRVAPGIYNVIVDGPRGRAVTRVAIVP